MTGTVSRPLTGCIAVLVDGQNTHQSALALGLHIDHARLRTAFARQGERIEAAYYATRPARAADADRLHRLGDWLRHHQWSVHIVEGQTPPPDEPLRRRTTTAMIAMAVHAMRLADRVDRVVLFTGNGDFAPLVEALQERGVHVTVVSTVRTDSPMAAASLQRLADVFLDLDDIRDLVTFETSLEAAE